MRYFSHTIAEYTCTKHCGFHSSRTGVNWSLFHLSAAGIATVPLWLFSLWKEFPWYCLMSVAAGELLLMYAAAFISALLLAPFGAMSTSKCPKCGAAMFFAGRHFDPKGSVKPHASDIVMLIVFIALNIFVWVQMAKGNLG